MRHFVLLSLLLAVHTCKIWKLLCQWTLLRVRRLLKASAVWKRSWKAAHCSLLVKMKQLTRQHPASPVGFGTSPCSLHLGLLGRITEQYQAAGRSQLILVKTMICSTVLLLGVSIQCTSNRASACFYSSLLKNCFLWVGIPSDEWLLWFFFFNFELFIGYL